MEFNQSEKDSIISKLNGIIEANLSDEHFGVSELAREMGMSRSTLHRKVKVITNITVSQYLRGMRLKRALKLLRESSMTVSEVAIESGFSSLAYFTKCFKYYYGLPPSKFSHIETTGKYPYEVPQQQSKEKKLSIKAVYVGIMVALITIIAVIVLILLPGPIIPNPFVREKTIAVLPYGDHTPEAGNAFLVEGLMNEIRYNLSLVEDLTVAPRASVERYRNTDKSWKEIGKELDVNYILECEADNNQEGAWIKLRLIDAANNKDLWSEPFEREISLENIFKVQKEVAMIVSNDLHAMLAEKEKEKIERIPTENIAAYNSYMLGRYYMNISIYSPDRTSSNQAVFNAKQHFEQAIQLDSAFADAYTALGSLYIDKLYYFTRDLDKARDYLDTGHFFLDRALFYEEGNLEALAGKARYYDRIGLHEDANEIWERLSQYGERSYEYYQHEVLRYYNVQDYYAAIESYRNYLQLKPEQSIQPPYLLRTMITIFWRTGYPEFEKILVDRLFDFTKDSLEYLQRMVSSEIYRGDFKAALDYALKARRLDSTNSNSNWTIALCYMWLKDYSNALHYLLISENLTRQSGAAVRPSYISGYIYHMNGYDTQTGYHFSGEIERRQKEIEHATPSAQHFYAHFYLATTYLALGDEQKALEYLKILDPPGIIDYGYINILVNWPGFDPIRNSPEYLEVLEHLEDRYQKQYKRIGKLTENLELNHP